MRVIAGSAKGTPLKATKGDTTRPTTDKIKESIFNIIQFDVEDRAVLDLFAGSGALGIEALSRGAASAVFVDQDRGAIQIIRENLQKTHLSDRAKIVQSDYQSFIQKNQSKQVFDLVFLDPPYAQKAINIVITQLIACKTLSNTAIIVCESGRDEQLPDEILTFTLLKQYVYGQTVLSVYIGNNA